MTPKDKYIIDFVKGVPAGSDVVTITIIKFVGAEICWCLERAIDLLLEIRNNTTGRSNKENVTSIPTKPEKPRGRFIKEGDLKKGRNAIEETKE